MVSVHGIYEYDDWRFEWSYHNGPWPMRKDGEPFSRAGTKFWDMVEKFEALTDDEQAACRIE